MLSSRSAVDHSAEVSRGPLSGLGRLGVLGAIGAAAALLVRRTGRSAVTAPSAVDDRRRLDRNVAVAGLGARTGSRWIGLQARRTFASAERRDELDRAFEVSTAEEVAAALGDMKGAMMKLGQMASYLDQGVPEHVRAVLAQLQADAPPMSRDLVADVVEAELGASPERVFAEWDPDPIAAASIGQVHRAITRDGRPIALKVQYPGIDEAMGADLDNADMLFRLFSIAFPGMDPGPLVEELRERLVEELDYEIEASNQRHFADYYAGHPHVVIPGVVDEYSTKRVLATELAHGVAFDEVLNWSQDERDLAGETIYRFVFESIYRVGAFNGDPHPGNYLFQPGGRVVFLDYGLVKRFSADEITLFEDLIRLMVLERDGAGFRALAEEAGLLRPAPEIGDAEVEDFFRPFYELVMDDAEVTITQEYASALVRRILDTSDEAARPIQRHANVPPAFVITQRINMGLYAVLGELGATANWRGIAEEIWPFVDGAPATVLGRASAAWRQSP